MTTEQQRYLAYMLRLWQVSSDGEPIWRTSLESPHTGERRGFADLETLFEFLGEQTSGQPKRKEQTEDISEPGGVFDIKVPLFCDEMELRR